MSPFANSDVSVMISHVTRPLRLSLALLSLILASFLQTSVAPRAQTTAPAANSLLPGPKPSDVSADWKHLVGIYGEEKGRSITILERDRKLFLITPPLCTGNKLEFPFEYLKTKESLSGDVIGVPIHLTFMADSSGQVTQLKTNIEVHASSGSAPNGHDSCRAVDTYFFLRADAGSDPTHFNHVHPAQPVSELREKALKLSPPAEPGPFRKPDLVELATLDPAIHLDIRYATANNFLSTPVYTEARAFMQRPAAEALLRVLHELQPLDYGLLIHDAYRPWYVTKIFWDATPSEGKIFVADPQKGSKHNRGCAVDLTLYDLATGRPVEMPGLYDEMSPRSFPNFPGGTSLQRWHRDLLRRAMESEGFTVNEDEWWHFDYKDWKQYGILNVPFEKIAVGEQPAAVSH